MIGRTWRTRRVEAILWRSGALTALVLVATLVGLVEPIHAARPQPPGSWTSSTTSPVQTLPGVVIPATRAGTSSSFVPRSAPVAAKGWVPRSECFPVEQLSPELRNEAEALLLNLLDGEGLYTVVTGLKPISGGFWFGRFEVENPDLTALERTRTLLSVFRCGDVFMADVRVFQRAVDGQRSAEAYIAHRPALAAKIAEFPDFFKPRGVTGNSSPAEVMTLIEIAEEPDRWRGQGYVYGYPREAVEFFVKAGIADRQAGPGALTPRRFVSIPTFASDTGRFVYAVDPNAPETKEDRRLKAAAAPILAEYRRRRALLPQTSVTPDSVPATPLGVVELVRDWFDDGWGRCHPDHAHRNLGRPLRWVERSTTTNASARTEFLVAPITPSLQR